MRKSWLAIVVGALGLALLAVYFYVRGGEPDYDGTVVVPGFRAEVEVWRDSLGVPHIWAQSAEDLFFAQGYVHAQDRLWQMELLRRVAEGRLAEVLGEDLIETDRFLRTIGLWRAAEASVRELGGEERRWLEAYVAGVNAGIQARRGALPPEFRVLRFEPEPWTLQHTLAIEKIMAWDLSAYRLEVELARAARRLGRETVEALREDYPGWGPTTVEGPSPVTGRGVGDGGLPQVATVPEALLPDVPAFAAALLEAGSIRRASNAWVIAGSRTRSGKPILANDMHLVLRAPSLWHLMALHGGGFDVVGLTLPGAPFVIAGRNRAVAWGFTSAMADDVDFFVERVDPADSTRYLTPTGSAPFEVVPETIQVRGRRGPVVVPVRWTRHGPVVTPVEEWTGGEVIALRWAGHDPARTTAAFPALNRASNWDEFVRAVEDLDSPNLNVVYADTAGHIGYILGGRIPLRGKGKRPPLLPVPGWTGEWDWTGELAFSEHPRVFDPPQGYIVTANNRQAPGPVAELITADWEEPFRAIRIRELILAGGPFDVGAVHRMQLDVGDALAARYRDRAVAAAEQAGLGEAAQLLAEWDLEASRDSRGAALFYVWYERLRAGAARLLHGDERGWFPRKAVNLLLERRSVPWVDGDGRAAFERIAVQAMREADSIVGGKRWGELNRVVIEHALGSVRLLARVLGLNLGPEPHGGSPSTVNVAYHLGGDFPVSTRYGPSQRHVVDLADGEGAGGFVIPTGQSGIPSSRHYRDQFRLWREGGLWRIPLEREAARGRVVHRQVLKPADGN